MMTGTRKVRSSRRTFLKTGAGLAAGAPFVPFLSAPAAAQAGDAELAALQRSRRIRLARGIVLTLDRQVGDFAAADVLIEDGKIAAIGPNVPERPDTVMVDCTNRIIVPGFVDTHVHSYQGLLRSTLPNGLVDPDYNRDIQNNLTLAYSPSDVHIGELITALTLIDMGTTTIIDIAQISHSPEHSDACIRGLQESGIRAVHAYSRGAGPAARYPQDIARLQRTYFNSSDQLLTLAMAVSTDPAIVRAARDAGVPAILHIRVDSEPFLQLGRAQLFRDGDMFIHATHMNEDAWRLIRDTGGRISQSPPLEMAMGHGFPAIQVALDHGVRPSLSSDHSATVAQDMFGMMRFAFSFQRLNILQRRMRNEQNVPPLLSCRDVLEFATVEGARCANLDLKVGTLSPGKEADIVVLKADRLDLWPVNNAFGTVVNLMNPSHVESVFIAGKPKKWRGGLVGVDAERIRRLAAEARDGLFQRSAFQVPLVG
jgi:cytosine/adenosine deaminase-related metal-dependent hydrolase